MEQPWAAPAWHHGGRFAWENKAMAYISRGQHRRGRGHSPLFAPFLMFLAIGGLAAVYVVYALWPRWPGAPVSLTAPALPIVIGGEMFNIEPAAIRQAVQRKSGTQERIDLAYLWPSLTPAELAAKDDMTPADPNERIFLTITNARDEMAASELIKTIYPRYFAPPGVAPAEGLTMRPFRDGTPYQGEDLISADSAPDDFTARCTRTGVGNTGMCLLERRIGHANVTVRFPRDWLADWKKVLYGIDSVLKRLHPAA
jgi:hypothetical protein